MEYRIHRCLHGEFEVFEKNKLPARSYFIPFSDRDSMQNTDFKNERYKSDRVVMLSGEWDFAYYKNLSSVPACLNTEIVSFDRVAVPSTWQRTGYDDIAYINTRYPFPKKPPYIPEDAPAGIYRRFFNLQGSFARRIITFLGVAGALAVYINGRYAGYSEGSHNTAEFDITHLIKDGENEILCVIYKWSNGTYLECQDMFRENGIFRDVYITNQADGYITDFLFRSEKNSDSTYDINIKADGCFDDDTQIAVTAADSSGQVLFDFKGAQAELKGLKVREWTAETPELYEVIIALSKNGEECEAVRTYIGFKDVKIQGEVFLFNGKAIKLKGVNHHDTHMTKGYAVSLEDLDRDARLMKEYNCNCVRTSHYPPDPAFITMCDMYGLYVIDEADIETHGFYAIPHTTYNPNKLSNDISWSKHYLDRVSRMYERDKNHPSITMWSLGNESGGYKCQDVCHDFLKEKNPQIPVHYEGVNRSKRWAYDVVSRMYAHPLLMRKVAAGAAGEKYKGKPFFQCEYAHAMGNGPGGLEEYMQLFMSSDIFMGGCIWEWADHSFYDENAKYKWTYGGDHNEPIHDGNFCVDGLFFPDRTPSSGALEMKAVYRPVRAKYLGGGKVELHNTRYFADTSDISVKWELTIDGIAENDGVVSPVIGSGEKAIFDIAGIDDADISHDAFINLTYTCKKSSFEIAREQLTVTTRKILPDIDFKGAVIKNEGRKITVTFDNGTAVFDKDAGLVSYKKDSCEYINSAPG